MEQNAIEREHRKNIPSQALQNAPITVATLDHELRYTRVYRTRHGFEPEDVIGKRADELILPAEAADTLALQKQVLESGVGAGPEIRGRTKGSSASSLS